MFDNKNKIKNNRLIRFDPSKSNKNPSKNKSQSGGPLQK